MSRFKTVNYIIYDLDGVLLDTERFYTQVTRIIAGRYDKVFDWTVKSKMLGKKALDSAAILTESLGLPLTPAQYLEERKELLEELFPQAEPLPGAIRLTQHVNRHGIPQAVATSSDRSAFELKTCHHKQWFDLFDCIVLGDDPEVLRGKPAPDIFLATAERLGAPPAQCLVFEDSPAGVEAAHSAGMAVVAIPDPNMDPAAFPAASEILGNLAEFDPTRWGLPPCD